MDNSRRVVRIKFVGVDVGFQPNWVDLYPILQKYYDVVIDEENPEYIICDAFEPFYEYCKYPQIRIMVDGENYVPDFNLVDYAISRYPIQYLDRNFYLPGCVWPRKHWLSLATKDRAAYNKEWLQSKQYFASFIAGHESEYGIRGDFFKKLCEYKRVESPGSYLNNMPDGTTVKWNNSSKTDFQSKCKFTLCFESTMHEGFITEKITDAFYADTIPVYYGTKMVTDIFNKNAFINCMDYASFDDVIEKIKELDQDDEKYLEMMHQPILKDPAYPERVLADMETFVCNIFEQPMEKAYRRSRVYLPKEHEDFLLWAAKKLHYQPIRVLKRIIKKCLRMS